MAHRMKGQSGVERIKVKGHLTEPELGGDEQPRRLALLSETSEHVFRARMGENNCVAVKQRVQILLSVKATQSSLWVVIRPLCGIRRS